VLSTRKCSGLVPSRRSGGTSSVFARRPSVEWEVKPEQSDDRADQTFGLAKRQAKHQAHRREHANLWGFCVKKTRERHAV
jgi:hypothetical protein